MQKTREANNSRRQAKRSLHTIASAPVFSEWFNLPMNERFVFPLLRSFQSLDSELAIAALQIWNRIDECVIGLFRMDVHQAADRAHLQLSRYLFAEESD